MTKQSTIENGEQEQGKAGPELYRAYSKLPRAFGYDDVRVIWFCDNRDEPAVAYEEVIAGYEELPEESDRENDRRGARAEISEFFTKEEAAVLGEAVAALRPGVLPGASFELERVEVPVSRAAGEAWWPTGAMGSGGGCHFYTLITKDDGEWFERIGIEVYGYCDTRHAGAWRYSTHLLRQLHSFCRQQGLSSWHWALAVDAKNKLDERYRELFPDESFLLFPGEGKGVALVVSGVVRLDEEGDIVGCCNTRGEGRWPYIQQQKEADAIPIPEGQAALADE